MRVVRFVTMGRANHLISAWILMTSAKNVLIPSQMSVMSAVMVIILIKIISAFPMKHANTLIIVVFVSTARLIYAIHVRTN